MIQKTYRLNNQIQAPKIRLLSSDGTQIGIVPIEEARQKALNSKEDLVEISGSADPPVVKLINFKKFRYQEAKKERESIKKVKKVDIKEIRLTPFMGESDFMIRLDRVREFLLEGNKVRLVVRFTGRQMAHPEFGYEMAKKVFDILKEIAVVEQQPRMIGRQIISSLTPIKK